MDNFLKNIPEYDVEESLTNPHEERIPISESNTSLANIPLGEGVPTLWFLWDEMMNNVKTKAELLFVLERFKHGMYAEIILGLDKNKILSFPQYSLPRKVFNNPRYYDFRYFTLGYTEKIYCYKLIAEWLSNMGLGYEMIIDKNLVYFKVMKN